MKNLIKNLTGLLVIFIAILLVSCSAEDGAAGPQGEPGQDGNANVIASDWIPEEFDDFSINVTSFSVTDQAFTQEILDSGTVLVYGRGGTSVLPLPIVSLNESYYFGLSVGLNQITFFVESVDGTFETFEMFTDLRYVIIPANNNNLKGKEVINFNQMTYYEVIDHFGFNY